MNNKEPVTSDINEVFKMYTNAINGLSASSHDAFGAVKAVLDSHAKRIKTLQNINIALVLGYVIIAITLLRGE